MNKVENIWCLLGAYYTLGNMQHALHRLLHLKLVMWRKDCYLILQVEKLRIREARQLTHVHITNAHSPEHETQCPAKCPMKEITYLNSRWPPLGAPHTNIPNKMDLRWGMDPELAGYPGQQCLCHLPFWERERWLPPLRMLLIFSSMQWDMQACCRCWSSIAPRSSWLPLTIFHHLWWATALIKPGCQGVWSQEREGRLDGLDVCVLNSVLSFTPHCKNPAEGPDHRPRRIRKAEAAPFLGQFYKPTQVPSGSRNRPSVT